MPAASAEMLGVSGFQVTIFRPFGLDWTGLGLTIKYPGGTDTAGVAEEIPTGVYPTPDIFEAIRWCVGCQYPGGRCSGILHSWKLQGDPSVVSLSSRARRAVFRRLEGEKQWNWGMKTSGVRVLVGLAMIARTSGWAAVDGILGKPLLWCPARML